MSSPYRSSQSNPQYRSEPQRSRRNVIDLEAALYVLQQQNPETLEWKTLGGAIRGRTSAHTLLNEQKEKDPFYRYRAVQKTDADNYRHGFKGGYDAGWKAAIQFALANPDNLLTGADVETIPDPANDMSDIY